jgi:fibronectin type 3 domain-containing protein
VYVFDTAGLSTPSNEQDGQTPVNEPPQAVSLLPVEMIPGSTTSLRLSWTQNNDQDFTSYKIYRSLTPGVSTNSVFVASIENRSQLSHTDLSLNENTTYYYKVYVFDTGGLSTSSNEVAGNTPVNEPPVAVMLFKPESLESDPTTLRISWTRNNDSDFANYKIYRSKTANVTTQSTFVASIENNTQLSHLDHNLDESTTYYYKIYVFDTGGLGTGSNEDFGATLAKIPPSPVTLAQPVPINGTILRLTWTQNADTDFESYRIYRSGSSPVDTTISIWIINSKTTTSYEDSNITAGTDYYYRVFVFDTNGLSSGSNEVYGKL